MKILKSVCVNNISRHLCNVRRKNFSLGLKRNYSDESQNSTFSNATPPWNVLFYGTDSFSLETLKVLNMDRLSGDSRTVNCLDVVTKAKLKKSPLAVKQYAEVNKLKVFDWPHFPANGTYDIGIVVSFGHLIPPEVIQAFPFGMLNVHGSLLPRWRGASPVANAILNGDTETGVTIMQISPHLFDVGNIVLQQSYAIPDDETATTAVIRPILAKMGADMMLTTLRDLRTYLDKSKSQDSSLATKAPKLKPSQAILKWDQHTCQHIDRLYRAMHDSIQLETSWHGSRVRLLNMVHPKEMIHIDVDKVAERQGITQSNRKPGIVLYHKIRKLLCILCTDGWIGFKGVLAEGHRTMSASDFYNGFLTKVKIDRRYFE